MARELLMGTSNFVFTYVEILDPKHLSLLTSSQHVNDKSMEKTKGKGRELINKSYKIMKEEFLGSCLLYTSRCV